MDTVPDVYDIFPLPDKSVLQNGILPDNFDASALEVVLGEHLTALGVDPSTVDFSHLPSTFQNLNNDSWLTLKEVLTGLVTDLQAAVNSFTANYKDADPKDASFPIEQWAADAIALGARARVTQILLKAVVPDALGTDFSSNLSSIIDLGNSAKKVRISLNNVVNQVIQAEITATEATFATLRFLPVTLGPVGVAFFDAVGDELNAEDYVGQNPLKALTKHLKSLAGDPVDTGSGEFVYDATDLSIEGRGIPLQIRRHYGSRVTRRGIIGPNWSMPMLEAHMLVLGNGNGKVRGLIVNWGDGNQSQFVRNAGSGLFVGGPGEYGSVLLDDTSTCADVNRVPGFIYRKPDGTTYWFCPPVWQAGSGGMLVSWLRAVSDPYGNAILYSRDSQGRVAEVIDTLGRSVLLEYNGPGDQLSSITDWTGRQVVYTYHPERLHLLRVDHPSTVYLAEGGTTHVAQPFEEYTYSEFYFGYDERPGSPLNHNLHTISSNGDVPRITVDYWPAPSDAEFDKVMSHTIDGHTTSYDYEFVTPAEHPYDDEVTLRTRVRYSSGEAEIFYHHEGLLYAHEKINGRVDSQFNVVSDVYTDPDEGITHLRWVTIYEYDSEFRIRKIVENTDQLSSGREVEFVYDEGNPDRFQHGNILQQIVRPDPSDVNATDQVTVVEYDPITARPRVTTDPLGRVTKRTFAHQEIPYDQVLSHGNFDKWNILPTASEDPARAAQLEALFGLGDQNGDGLQDGMYQPVLLEQPSLSIEAASGPGSPSAVTPTQAIQYNAHGQPIQIEDVKGVLTTLEYEGGYLSSTVNDSGGLGFVTSYEFDDLGRPIKSTKPDGSKVQTAFDARGNAIEVRLKPTTMNYGVQGTNTYEALTPADGNDQKDIVEMFFYDLRGRYVGNTTRFYASSELPGYGPGLIPDLLNVYSYNEAEEVSLFRRNILTPATPPEFYHDIGPSPFEEHGDADPPNVSSPVGWEYEYDGKNQLTRHITPLGAVYTYEYDTRGNVISVALEDIIGCCDLGTWHLEYSAFGDRTSITSPMGRKTTFEYDGHGRLVKETSASGLTTDYVLDAIGRVEEEIVGGTLSHTLFDYDSADRLVSRTTANRAINPDGTTTNLSPDWIVESYGWGIAENELLWEVLEPNGINYLRRNQYDSIGRRYASYVGPGDEVGYHEQLDPAGRVVTRTEKLDNQGTQGIVSPSESTWSYGYDSHGRLRVSVDPNGQTTTTYRRPDDQPAETISPNGLTDVFVYDSAGRLVHSKQLDRAGGLRQSVRQYDATDNLVSIVDPEEKATEFFYDPLGLLHAKKYTNGWEVLALFNKDQQVRSIRYQLPSAEENPHDTNPQGLGNPGAPPPPDPLDNWPVVDYAYDSAGRLETLTATGWDADVLRTYSYDALDRPSAWTESTGGRPTTQTKNVYSSRGVLLSDEQSVGSLAPKVTDVTTDAAGNIRDMVYPSGLVVRRFYDALRRPTRIRAVGGTVFADYQDHYGLKKPRTTLLAGGGTEVRDYDPRSRLTRGEVLDSNSQPIAGYSLQYDQETSDLLLRTHTASSTVEAFDYSTYGEVTGWQYDVNGAVAGRSVSWDRDRNTNPEAKTDTAVTVPFDIHHNGLNQLKKLEPYFSSITYDLGGNQRKRVGTGSTETWEWDALGRPYSASTGIGSNTVDFLYDPLGRLLWRQDSSNGLHKYSYYSDQLVEHAKVGGERIDVVAGYDGQEPLARIDGVGVLYYHVDHTGNVTDLHDSQSAVEQYYYEPYGRAYLRANDAQAFGQSQYQNDLLFQSKVADPTLGTSWLSHRAYDPLTEGFMSRDPIGELGGLNLYSYGLGNPIRFRDPSGLAPTDVQSPGVVPLLSTSNRTENGGIIVFGSALETINAMLDAWSAHPELESVNGTDFLALGFEDMRKTLNVYLKEHAGETHEAVQNTREWAVDTLGRLSILGSFEGAFALFDLPQTLLEGGLESIGLGSDTAFWTSNVISAVAPGKYTKWGSKLAQKEGMRAARLIAQRSARGSTRLAGSTVRSAGGRLGNASTRAHVDEVATTLERRGYTITGGGGRLPEEYLPGPGGARRGSSYPDITATRDGRTLRINTIDTLVDGVTPTAREARNATRIRGQTPGDHLLLIPKPR